MIENCEPDVQYIRGLVLGVGDDTRNNKGKVYVGRRRDFDYMFACKILKY